MRHTRAILPRAILAVATLGLAGLAGSAAFSTRPTPPSLLRPLGIADYNRAGEPGCAYQFDVRTARDRVDTLAYLTASTLLIRTDRLNVCRVTERQFQAVGERGGTLNCGGGSIVIRRTGRITHSPESDSSDGPATMTVTAGRRSQVLRGSWGVAC